MSTQTSKTMEYDPIAKMGIKIISADDHINEPRDLFTSRFPSHLRDKAPRLVRGADGGDGWSWEGEMPKRTYGLEAMAGFEKKDFRVSGLRYEDLRPGNYDPDEFLKDLDIDGTYGSVIYPAASIRIYTVKDHEVAAAAVTVYNDWILDDFQATDSKRLCALAIAPIEFGIDYSISELKRVVKKGARAMLIPGLPTIPYNHPTHYEPFWQAANELGVTLTIHRNHGGPSDKTDWDFLDEDKVSIGGIVTRYFSAVRPLSYLVFGGLFDRYPNLKIVVSEVDCGWVPFWVHTMEANWDIQKSWFPVKLKHRPKDFIGKNIFSTFMDDYVGYEMIKTGLFPYMSDMSMFCSDYPHSVTTWPNSRKVAAETIKGMKEEDARKILSGNAARVFGFDI